MTEPTVATHVLINPAHRASVGRPTVAARPTRRPGDRRARSTRRARPPSRPGGARRARASGPGCCAGSPPSSTRTSRSSPSSRCATPGTPIGNARWEAGNVRDVPRLLLRPRPERLFGRQIPVAGGVDVTFHEPLGVVGVIVPWNFPMPIAGWGFAPGAGRRQHGRAQAGRADAADRDPARRAGPRGRAARGRASRCCPGKGSVVGRAVRRPTRWCARSCFTGSTEVGKRIMAGCADQVKRVTLELGGKSANIVFADADLERAAADRAVRASSTTPARTAAPARRILVAARGVRPVPGAARAGGAGRAGRATRRAETAEMGPLISAGAARRGARRTSGRRRPVAFRGAAPGRRRASGSRRRCVLAGRPTDRGLARGGLRAGRRGAAVRRRGRRDRAGQRHASTACPARSGPATSAGRCGSPAASRPATCRSTRTRRCATGRRSAASSSPASAASSGPDALDAVHRGQERLHRHDELETSDVTSMRRWTGWQADRVAVDHRRRQRHRAGDRAPVRRRGRAGRRRRHRRRRRRGASADEVGGHVRARATSPTRTQVDALFAHARRTTYGSVDIAFNNAGISPPDDDSILDHRPRRLASGCRRST